MARRIKELQVDREFTEFAVEYSINDELFIYEAEDEDEARLIRAKLNGKVLVRQVFETSWAD